MYAAPGQSSVPSGEFGDQKKKTDQAVPLSEHAGQSEEAALAGFRQEGGTRVEPQSAIRALHDLNRFGITT
jgi:hypothetical protein